MNELNLALGKSKENWFGVLVDNEDKLVASAFSHSRKRVEEYMIAYSRRMQGQKPEHREHVLVEEMGNLFQGRQASISWKLASKYSSLFQKKVGNVLQEIPKGTVSTYGLIARRIGSGPRAVGNAVASNPWPLFVPCHRVVPSSLSVGNYSLCGSLPGEGSSVKRQLLEREGVSFVGTRIVPKALWNFGE